MTPQPSFRGGRHRRPPSRARPRPLLSALALFAAACATVPGGGAVAAHYSSVPTLRSTGASGPVSDMWDWRGKVEE